MTLEPRSVGTMTNGGRNTFGRMLWGRQKRLMALRWMAQFVLASRNQANRSTWTPWVELGKTHSYLSGPVWENELQGWSQQGGKKALWLRHRLRVGVSNCLGVKRDNGGKVMEWVWSGEQVRSVTAVMAFLCNIGLLSNKEWNLYRAQRRYSCECHIGGWPWWSHLTSLVSHETHKSPTISYARMAR